MTVFYAIIPSRMKSTRLPEKPLKDIAGRPMVVRVAERAKAKGIDTVVFDRGGYLYHGRVAELAEGAREGGLEF